MPCRCNTQVNQLLSQINAPSQNLGSPNLGNFLRNLGIFDLRNVFVYCLECSISRQQNQCPEIIVTPISVHGCVVDKPGIYIVVGKPSLGSQCRHNQNLRCNTNSTIIDIGSSNNLLRRFAYFISELKDDFCGKLHSTAHRIRRAILNAYTSQNQTCLYIIGFPLLTNIPPQINQVITQIRNRVGRNNLSLEEIAEACFLDTYNSHYRGLPCCVRGAPPRKLIQSIFQYISYIFNSPQPQRDIQNILDAIDSTFQNCISQC